MPWIRIGTQLPAEDQRVIYYFEHTGVSRGRFTMTEWGPCFYGRGGWLTGDVTHWMPDDGRGMPPLPPKGARYEKKTSKIVAAPPSEETGDGP